MAPYYREIPATKRRNFKNPFERAWITDNCAASAGGQTSKGIKGIFAGGIAGAIEICITYPTEFIKTHLQLDETGDKKKYDGIIDCLKKTLKTHGFFGLYRGLSILLVGTIPKNAVRFGTFEFYKEHLALPSGNLSLGGRFLCGLGAGVNEAIVVVTPMETIKVKFINDRRREEPRYRGFIHGIAMIIKVDGMGGLYKGVTTTVLKQVTYFQYLLFL